MINFVIISFFTVMLKWLISHRHWKKGVPTIAQGVLSTLYNRSHSIVWWNIQSPGILFSKFSCMRVMVIPLRPPSMLSCVPWMYLLTIPSCQWLNSNMHCSSRITCSWFELSLLRLAARMTVYLWKFMKLRLFLSESLPNTVKACDGTWWLWREDGGLT